MERLHQFTRGMHQKQAPHAHHDHPHEGEAHDEGARLMRLLSIAGGIAHNEKYMSDYRTSRLVPASNGVIVGTILVLAAGVVLWHLLPTNLSGVALAVIIAAGAHLGVVVIGGLAITLFIRAQRSKMRRMVIDFIAWRGTERVLDVGCGTGMLLNGCAQKLTTGRATGIDLWQQAVAGTRDVLMRNARAEGVADRIDLREMDARDLKFEDSSFDVVVSSVALHHIGTERRDREQAVSEMIRVLAPGGTLSLLDIGSMIDIAESVVQQSGLQITTRKQNRFFRCMTAIKQ